MNKVVWDAVEINGITYHVAKSSKGLVAMSLGGEDEASFAKSVHKRVPDAELVHDPAALAVEFQQVREYFAGERHTFDVALDVRGTAFQEAVWAAMCDIPYGETRSYLDIARTIGNEKSVRAVGGACGANSIPLIIPCHRVVGKSGAMTGFSAAGGIQTKEHLLRFEAERSQKGLFSTQ
jgi:methylated-DNA-[protein]-cysteine S-methyltransferase